ncbi:diguanylate cyclase [Spirochaetia bacterium]|nr:diguanylate cyclase [Spirochaetia bacterium]
MARTQEERDFFSSPGVLEHYIILREIGVFRYIDSLNKEIHNYKNLLSGAADIFNRTSIEEIMDATVWQISDHFLPSFITFLWKPMQNREDVTIKSYKNYKLVDLSIKLQTIAPFEPYFQKHREPVSFQQLAGQMTGVPALSALKELQPALVIPILGLSGLYGLILVGRKLLEDDYTLQELDFVRRLMSFVSQAIQNHLHYEHSVRDVKTGLFNHGFFMTRLSEEIARAKRTGESSSLIVIDVDKFKDFNDSYGHLAGDRVLESLAYMIKQNVRAEDIPSRFGGEEFTIVLPNTDRATAWVVAERLRTSIAEMQVSWDPPLPQVTISLGLVTFTRSTGLSAESVINRADEALYQSKARGRNRTTVWRSGLLFKIEQSAGDKK